ncbi:MAG: hypothetical protein ACRED3_09180 [Bradyrhizobium sp.]
MADVTLTTLFILFLPFLLSLFGQGGMAKLLTLYTSILAVLLRVDVHGAELPWIIGMIIALISVWERIRQRRMA